MDKIDILKNEKKSRHVIKRDTLVVLLENQR